MAPPRQGLTHPLVGFRAESVQSDLAREVCDAGDVGVVLLQGRQTHLLPSSTQRLHLESRSRAPPAGADSRTGKCHPGKVPPAQSAPHFRLSAWPYGGWYFSYSAPPLPRPGSLVPISLGPHLPEGAAAAAAPWRGCRPGSSLTWPDLSSFHELSRLRPAECKISTEGVSGSGAESKCYCGNEISMDRLENSEQMRKCVCVTSTLCYLRLQTAPPRLTILERNISKQLN